MEELIAEPLFSPTARSLLFREDSKKRHDQVDVHGPRCRKARRFRTLFGVHHGVPSVKSENVHK